MRISLGTKRKNMATVAFLAKMEGRQAAAGANASDSANHACEFAKSTVHGVRCNSPAACLAKRTSRKKAGSLNGLSFCAALQADDIE